MAIVLRSWQGHQRAAISKILRVRCDAEIDLGAPYSRPSVSVVTNFDRDFIKFAREVGRDADAMWLRILQHVARTDGMGGCIELEPHEFGKFALSRPWDSVSRAKGERVYAALLTSSLAEPVTSECGICGGSAGVTGHVICDATIDVIDDVIGSDKWKWKKKGKRKKETRAESSSAQEGASASARPQRAKTDGARLVDLKARLDALYQRDPRRHPMARIVPLKNLAVFADSVHEAEHYLAKHEIGDNGHG